MDTPRETSASQESVETVKIIEIRNHPSTLRLQGRYRFDDLNTADDLVCDWSLRPETAGFTVFGALHGNLSCECGRCLAHFNVPIDLQIHERYVYDHYVDPSEREKELQAEDFFEVVNEDGLLDLKDLAYQVLILEAENQSTCGQAECSFTENISPID